MVAGPAIVSLATSANLLPNENPVELNFGKATDAVSLTGVLLSVVLSCDLLFETGTFLISRVVPSALFERIKNPPGGIAGLALTPRVSFRRLFLGARSRLGVEKLAGPNEESLEGISNDMSADLTAESRRSRRSSKPL